MKVKPMQKCPETYVYSLEWPWEADSTILYRSLFENGPTSHLIYNISVSSPIQHDVQISIYGPIYNKNGW